MKGKTDHRPRSRKLQRLMLNKNVLEATRERMAWLHDRFEYIVCAWSGGKDSTVQMELALEAARACDRLPLKVLWIDQEAEYGSTVELARPHSGPT